MKVLAFNGSPKKEGNTWHAIKMVTAELDESSHQLSRNADSDVQLLEYSSWRTIGRGY